MTTILYEEGGSVYFANLDKTIIKLFDKDVYDLFL